jgi:chromate reductase
VSGRRYRVATIVGSLRRRSYNRSLMQTAMLVAPEHMSLFEIAIDRLPFFDEDLEHPGDPPAVAEFRQALDRCDALLIFTPEYGYSIPGVLKNALDWASRPPGRSVLRGMPLGILGASAGRSGTMRAQLHLRQVALHMGAITLPSPEVYLSFAEGKFNGLGELTDQTSLDQVKAFMAAFDEWVRLLVPDR